MIPFLIDPSCLGEEIIDFMFIGEIEEENEDNLDENEDEESDDEEEDLK